MSELTYTLDRPRRLLTPGSMIKVRTGFGRDVQMRVRSITYDEPYLWAWEPISGRLMRIRVIEVSA